VDKVITKLTTQFPSVDGAKGFADGRLHSFRHYFCSRCANSSVPERMIMEWLGHSDSEMVRHYYHMCDTEARRHMEGLDLLGNAGKRVTGLS
jgi:integrase